MIRDNDTCLEHDCPLFDAGDGTLVCLWETIDALTGQMLSDLIVEDGETVLIFPGGAFPLVGWRGNVLAAEDFESADALLNVLEGNYLLRGELHDRRISIYLADEPDVKAQWEFDLTW